MGNLVTKLTTNSVPLNESTVSDIVIYEVCEISTKNKFLVHRISKNFLAFFSLNNKAAAAGKKGQRNADGSSDQDRTV
jgi:hypothetical protein